MTCPFLEYREGVRSFGYNIPCFAQGAYFPGDEPGHHCSLSGEPCDGNAHVSECARFNETASVMHCPECWSAGEFTVLLEDHDTGELGCPECDSRYRSRLERVKAMREVLATEMEGPCYA